VEILKGVFELNGKYCLIWRDDVITITRLLDY
jgi:hypothetical protein